MITPILTFLSTRLVYVLVTTVVVIVAVPAVIGGIRGDGVSVTAASSSRHHDDEERAQVILVIKQAGDAVVVKLDDAEAACDAQISQLAVQSKVSAPATAAAVKKGKDDYHAAVAPYVAEVQADEDELEHLAVVTSATEQTYLVRIQEVEVIALGQAGHPGVLDTICQTIVVEVRQTVTVVVNPGGGEGDDEDARFAPLLR